MNLVDFRFLAILLTSFVISCGGGGGGGGGAVSTPLIGYVVDAPVEGLSYSCGGLAGTVILPFCKGLRSRNITQPWPTAV
jgi:hypothetical protein